MNRAIALAVTLSVAPAGTAAFAQAAPADQSPAAGAAALSEVVVTAQRRAENVQNVPITVEAVSGAALAASGVSNIQDIQLVVPGVNFTDNSGYIIGHVRGIGSSATAPSLEPPVAVYVDGVYYASTVGSNFNFIDVAQVEVLKGPQGTLFGRNATAGLIQITTKDPSQEPHLDADFGYGNYDTATGHFYVSGGLAPNLAGSFSAEASAQGDGYGKNFDTGRDVYREYGEMSLRSKLLWTPTDDTRVTLILDYSQNRNSDNSLRVAPGTLPPPPTGPAYGGSPWDTDADGQPLTFTRTGGASLKFQQKLPFANLIDTIAYRQSSFFFTFDPDATPTKSEVITLPQAEHQFSNELQLQSLPSSKVSWAAGVYYINLTGADNGLSVVFPTPSLDRLYPINDVVQNADQYVTSVATYGQATVPLFDATNLTLGGRYTYEKHQLIGTETGDIGTTPIATLANLNSSKDWSSLTWRVALDHRFSDQLLAYGSVSTGFKSGGYNPDAITTPVFNPETLTAYEVGLKSDLLDRRLRVDVSGFYYDYKNIQEQAHVGASPTPVIVNAAVAHISGADLDFQAKITPVFTLQGGVEYLHSIFASFPNAPISSPLGTTPLGVGSASGNTVPYSPKAVVNIGADYTINNVYNGNVHLNVAYLYNTGYYLEVDDVIHQPSFSEVNASISWKSSDSHYSVSVWANNLTNAVVSHLDITEASGVQLEQFDPPRTFGFTVGYHY